MRHNGPQHTFFRTYFHNIYKLNASLTIKIHTIKFLIMQICLQIYSLPCIQTNEILPLYVYLHSNSMHTLRPESGKLGGTHSSEANQQLTSFYLVFQLQSCLSVTLIRRHLLASLGYLYWLPKCKKEYKTWKKFSKVHKSNTYTSVYFYVLL